MRSSRSEARIRGGEEGEEGEEGVAARVVGGTQTEATQTRACERGRVRDAENNDLLTRVDKTKLDRSYPPRVGGGLYTF